MMVFKQLKFTPNFAKGHVIEWSLNPSFCTDGPLVFTLQLAETPDFSELIAEIVVGDQLFAVDNTKSKLTLGDVIRYRVKLQTKSKLYYSDSLTFGENIDTVRKYLLAAELQRKELLRINYAPSRGWLLKRKTYGLVDTANVSFVSGIPIADNTSDYGTGIVGGYYRPLGMMWTLEKQNQSKKLASDDSNLHEDYTIDIRTIGFPALEDRDIIIDASDDTRYSVESHNNKYFPGTTVNILQTATLKQLSPSESVYNIQVPKEYQSVYVQ